MVLQLKLEWWNPVQKTLKDVSRKCTMPLNEHDQCGRFLIECWLHAKEVLRNTSMGDLIKWILPYTFLCICIRCTLKHSIAYSLGSGRGTEMSYLECHSKNIFCVSWSTQDGHADNILSEVYGAISVLDGVKETAIKTLELLLRWIALYTLRSRKRDVCLASTALNVNVI